MTTWYQVYTNHNVYGFKTDGKTVLDHPDKFWIGKSLEDFRKVCTKDIVKQISKIADICE